MVAEIRFTPPRRARRLMHAISTMSVVEQLWYMPDIVVRDTINVVAQDFAAWSQPDAKQ
jgi:hypothetical protein